ncbi:MAG TPA: OmpA family protein [Bacteroidales bacterium]|nr:OmpA family protein [Bacteroidales bacterium]
MAKKTRFVYFLLLLMSCNILLAQAGNQLSTRNARARRAYVQATSAWTLKDFNRTVSFLKQAVELDRNFVEAHLFLGEVFYTSRNFEKSIQPYIKAIEINPELFPQARYYLGSALLKTGRYLESKEQFDVFIEQKGISEGLRNASLAGLETIRFALHAIANPVPFSPMNLGLSINSNLPDYSPTLTADEQTLIFTRKIPDHDRPGHPNRFQEDFFISRRIDSQWLAADNLGAPINTAWNEGAQTLTPDGLQLFFTACNRPDGFGSCDIYYSQLRVIGWTPPKNIGPVVNSPVWDSQPSVSSDGRTLYFASARPGGQGEMDIWYSRKDESGEWSAPQNLGPGINTPAREMSPFIHADGKTLYFASNGHTGMGGLDLFISRLDSAGYWSIPVNLGYPINTFADEFSLIVGASGLNAYFASDHHQGFGDTDIYHFELHVEARPSSVTYMRGIVFDKETLERLHADFQLTDLETGQTLAVSTSDPTTGKFLVAIPTGKPVALTVEHPGYLFFSEHFSYAETRTGVDPYLRDIPLQPMKEGETVILRNIFFDTGKFELKPESVIELKKLVELLDRNPGMNIEISGHTDNVGTFVFNLELSRNRARSVMQFLINAGIASGRLTYEGYADTQPIDTNLTEQGRANNRRTEFRITQF